MGYETDLADVELNGSITKIELMATDNRDLHPHELGALMLCKHKGIESMHIADVPSASRQPEVDNINNTSNRRDDHNPEQIQYVEFTPTDPHPSSTMEFSLGKKLMRELLEHGIIVSAFTYNDDFSDHDHKIYFNEITVGSDF